MKKIYCLMLPLLLNFTSNGQDNTTSREAKRNVTFGLKGGLNRSNVFDEKGLDFVADPKTGGVGGFFLAIPVGSFIGFQPEVLLSQKGFSGTGTILDQKYQISRTTTYLDIPLQLQVKPFKFFFMYLGLQYSYLLKQRDVLQDGPYYQQIDQEFKNDNIRKNILGAVTGFDINIRHIVLSGRAGWDIISNHGDGTSSTPRYKNLWLQGTVGFRFY